MKFSILNVPNAETIYMLILTIFSSVYIFRGLRTAAAAAVWRLSIRRVAGITVCRLHCNFFITVYRNIQSVIILVFLVISIVIIIFIFIWAAHWFVFVWQRWSSSCFLWDGTATPANHTIIHTNNIAHCHSLLLILLGRVRLQSLQSRHVKLVVLLLNEWNDVSAE